MIRKIFENHKNKILAELRKHMAILAVFYDGKFGNVIHKDSLGKQGEFIGYIFVEPELTKEIFESNDVAGKQNALLNLFDEIESYSSYMSGNNFFASNIS